MSKILIFTTYNGTPKNPNMFEFVEKNTNFLCDMYDEVTYLDINHKHNNNTYYEYLKENLNKYSSNTKVSKLEINIDSLFEGFIREEGINPKKLENIFKYIPQIEEYDCFYTYGNFVTFSLNNDINKSDLKFEDLARYNFDMTVPYYVNYLVVKELMNQCNIKKIQFYSDPLDIPFQDFIRCTPDTHNKTIFDEFTPIYQYYYNVVNKPSKKHAKSNILVMGNSCGDEYRKYLFDRYVLDFYKKYQTDARYKFYASGYSGYQAKIDNFIEHNDFYEEIAKSRYGLVLNTYSKNIISANKISMMLSRDCLPIITEGSDEMSEYLPSDIRKDLTVRNSIELDEWIENNTDEDYDSLMRRLKDYYIEDYLEILKKVFL